MTRANSEIRLIKRKIGIKIIAKLIIWYIKNQKPKMALTIKTASELSSLIPAFSGNSEGLKSFVDALNLVKTITPTENINAVIQIILTKLSGKARNLFSQTPGSIDEIVEKIQSSCADKSTSDLALSNLKNLKCKNFEDLTNFSKQVNVLAEKL